MILFLLLLIFLLIAILVVLQLKIQKLKHDFELENEILSSKMKSLVEKQKLLFDKVTILQEYKVNYLKDIKVIGSEIVDLQKIFISCISNQ